MSHKYDATQILEQMRFDLDRKAESFQRVCGAASAYDDASSAYAAAYRDALADGWTRQQLSHLPTPPKTPKNDE